MYSAANEDSRSELRALQLGPQDTVLCVTGSGARPLDLLIANPERVVSVDLNYHQNFLLQLKMAALGSLEYEDYACFLGLWEASDRLSQYASLRSVMPSDARAYWDAREQVIGKGVLYCGVWERYLRLLQLPFFLRRPLIGQLFECEDLDSQRDLWFKSWRNWVWLYGLRLISQRFVWRYLLREPGIEFVAPDFPIADYFLHKFDFLAQNHLLKESAFANLLFRGKFSQHSLPKHLQAEHFARLRDSLHKIKICTESLTEHCAKHHKRYDAFSLSDFSSYCHIDLYKEIWTQVQHSAKPGARLCERHFLVPYDPGQWFSETFQRDSVLESELESSDRSFLYTFVCGRFLA